MGNRVTFGLVCIPFPFFRYWGHVPVSSLKLVFKSLNHDVDLQEGFGQLSEESDSGILYRSHQNSIRNVEFLARSNCLAFVRITIFSMLTLSVVQLLLVGSFNGWYFASPSFICLSAMARQRCQIESPLAQEALARTLQPTKVALFGKNDASERLPLFLSLVDVAAVANANSARTVLDSALMRTAPLSKPFDPLLCDCVRNLLVTSVLDAVYPRRHRHLRVAHHWCLCYPSVWRCDYSPVDTSTYAPIRVVPLVRHAHCSPVPRFHLASLLPSFPSPPFPSPYPIISRAQAAAAPCRTCFPLYEVRCGR